jgi:hypothetical protein
MPITFSFDIEESTVKDTNDRTRIQLAFLRLGWEQVGGSSWRYPCLGASHPSEDWFNHVVPALMYFRALVEHAGIKVTRYALDAHSAAAYKNGSAPIGSAILSAQSVVGYPPQLDASHEAKLSEARLKQFIEDAAKSLK